MLNQDYKDMLLCLEKAGADFVIVGAYAMAAHGYPRATGDIDIWVRPTPDNATKVYAALSAFGAPTATFSASDLNEYGNVIQIGVAPCRIDLLTHIDGVDFDEVWKKRIISNIDGLAVPIIALDDLITNKSSTGRSKDLHDVAVLKNLSGH